MVTESINLEVKDLRVEVAFREREVWEGSKKVLKRIDKEFISPTRWVRSKTNFF